jgi:flagellar biosynthesis/type III secretory pathway protein FliH
MKFDDQLKGSFDTMTERLRAEVDRQVEVVVNSLTAAAKAERDHAVSEARDSAAREAAVELKTVVAAARQEAHKEGLAAGKDEARRESLEAGRKQGLEEGRTLGLEEGRKLGLEEGRKLGLEEGRKQGLEDGRQQGREEGRKQALEEGRKQGSEEGRQRGLDEGRKQGSEEGRQQGLEEGRQQGVLEGREQGVLEGREQTERESHAALDAAVAAARAERVVDTGNTERLAESVRAIASARSLAEILDTLVSCAGRESERAGVWVIRAGRLHHWRSTGAAAAAEPDLALDDRGAVAEAARKNSVATSDDTLAVPIAMAGQVVAVLFAIPSANSGAIEILARYAARCLEALTAFKAARTLTEQPGEPSMESRVASDEASVEEDASARRYARLLVSEIKLYHEAAVVDGRRDRDLATRLGGEIARARVLYEQRVPPQVRKRADYFHDELVRTLANGDATLLQLT